jgi:hypothetical protein
VEDLTSPIGGLLLIVIFAYTIHCSKLAGRFNRSDSGEKDFKSSMFDAQQPPVIEAAASQKWFQSSP